jgi:dienelactone hydrolase
MTRAEHEGLGEPHGVKSQYLPLGGPAWGLFSTPAHAADAPMLPAVILLGDGGGPDGRLQLYALRLLSLGFAVLDADDDTAISSDIGLSPADEVPAPLRLAEALSALRVLPGVAPARIVVIAIGAGAHGMLASVAAWPRPVAALVLVYPACSELLASMAPGAPLVGAPARARLLLVHGDADPAETAACVRLTAALARKIHQGWRAWCNPLIGHRVRLRHQNPAVSGHHARRRRRYAALAGPVTGRRQADHRPLRRWVPVIRWRPAGAA